MSIAPKYIPHKQINKTKWDTCIAASPNGYIYCRSFYLDGMCTWDALVAGDYEYIFPLPFKSKWGIAYLYNPYFVGQLGVISSHPITAAIIQAFIQTIPARFKYIDIDLNENNLLPTLPAGQLTLRKNYVLPLQQPYHCIEKKYTKDAKKNLRRAEIHGLIAVEAIDPALVVAFFKQAYGELNKGISEKDYHHFTQVCKLALEKQQGFTMGIYTATGQLVAAAFFGKDEKRIYYICGAPSAHGRIAKAQQVLIDTVIKKYAGTHYLLDFEGSDIPSVEAFYKKFSPTLHCYPHLRLNRLPGWLKWLKK